MVKINYESRDEILNGLKILLKDNTQQLDRNILKNIKEEYRLKEDLGFDSLDICDMMWQIEDFFNVSMCDRDFSEFKNIEDVINYIIKQ